MTLPCETFNSVSAVLTLHVLNVYVGMPNLLQPANP